MKMPKVDNFLGCMRLETGGLVIAWFHAIFDVCFFILGVTVLVLCSIDCIHVEDDRPVLKEILESFCEGYGRIAFGIIAVVVVILSICSSIFSFLCIRGMSKRNHTYVRPMMVLMGVLTVSSFLKVFSCEPVLILLAIVTTIYHAYQFIILYSIHSKFQNEFMSTGLTAQYHAPTEKV